MTLGVTDSGKDVRIDLFERITVRRDMANGRILSPLSDRVRYQRQYRGVPGPDRAGKQIIAFGGIDPA